MSGVSPIPLFEAYPGLTRRAPHVALGSWPTPVDSNNTLAESIGAASVSLKRDDVSGAIYGGNKVRKLEFLLGDALRRGAREVLTVGYAGSNHALATAVYAKQVGLGAISMLLPQVNAKSVQRNLLAGFHHGAELHTRPNVGALTRAVAWQFLRHVAKTRRLPYYIPAGGSSPLGVLGFVNAAYEVARQIEEGVCPTPDVVYVAVGSMGSLVGLHLGFQALRLPIRVVGVRVTPVDFASEAKVESLFGATVAALRKYDPSFPNVIMNPDLWELRGEFFGEEYGRYTEAGAEATGHLREAGGGSLDGTYSAKAFAAMKSDGDRGLLEDKDVLFWLTYNSRDMTPLTGEVDYHALPHAFHEYFETAVQPLDA